MSKGAKAKDQQQQQQKQKQQQPKQQKQTQKQQQKGNGSSPPAQPIVYLHSNGNGRRPQPPLSSSRVHPGVFPFPHLHSQGYMPAGMPMGGRPPFPPPPVGGPGPGPPFMMGGYAPPPPPHPSFFLPPGARPLSPSPPMMGPRMMPHPPGMMPMSPGPAMQPMQHPRHPPSPPPQPNPNPPPPGAGPRPAAPLAFYGRAAWERGLGGMLKVEDRERTLSLPKYGVRLLVPRRPEQQQGQQQQQQHEGPIEMNDDPTLPLDLGVLTIACEEDGDAAGGAGQEEEEEEEEPFVPKGYEAAPPVMLSAAFQAPSEPLRHQQPAAWLLPSRATRLLRIEHENSGPCLLREVLVLPRDEPGSGVWLEVEVGGWVFSSLVGQGPALAEAEDAPEPLLSGVQEYKDVLLPPGAADASVSVVAEQDADAVVVRKWLLLRLEGPGVGTPADMHVHHFVVARRVLATVADANAASLLNVEAKPFVPTELKQWFSWPCAVLVDWPTDPPPFQPRAFAAFLQTLGEYPLSPRIRKAIDDYKAQCVARQGTDAPLPDPYALLGIRRQEKTPAAYIKGLRVLVELEEIQADLDMSRYDLFSVALDYKPATSHHQADKDGQQATKAPPLVTSIIVPGAAENRPPLAYGDEVRLRPATAGATKRGANKGPVLEVRARVLKRKEDRVTLLLPPHFNTEERGGLPPGSRWHVRFCYERFAYRFLHAALDRLEQEQHEQDEWGASATTNAMRFLFPQQDVEPVPPPVVAAERGMGWINPLVNEEQKAAVMAIVNGAHGENPFLLFGPPGTGKTLTVIEAVLQVCRHLPDARVLAVAPSDVAADILCDRLSQTLRPSELFRLNWYSRRFESMKISLLPYACFDSESGLFSLPADPDPFSFLQRTKVVVCTCAASGLLALLQRQGEPSLDFSHIFVDESSQALQPEILVPLSLATPDTSVILAGDPKQLGPSTRSPLISQLGLAKSLQEHLMDTRAIYDVHKPVASDGARTYIVQLRKNYRSHEAIMEVPSTLFYERSLEQRGDPSIINSMLDFEMLPGAAPTSSPTAGMPISSPLSRGGKDGGGFPILVYGVQGEHMHELDSPSFFNPMECSKVLDLIRALVGSQRVRVGLGDIGVITAFRQQVLKLRALLRQHGFGAVNVGQVEDFQGQEARVVIISTVLSARHPDEMREQLGFLGHPKRFNVAVTRAQALIIVVGNPFALMEDTAGWRQLLEYCAEHGSYRGCDCPLLRAKDVDGVDSLLDAIAIEALLGGAAASSVYPTSLEDWFSDSPWRLLL